MRVRTLAIDEAVLAAARDGIRQLVVLGADLCARAWRMEGLADTKVYEVDYPATQDYKRTRLGDLAPKARGVKFVGVDFETDDLKRALEAAGHERAAPTTWIWEGVTASERQRLHREIRTGESVALALSQ
jgi:methyltransferase (TIGR00027 family)